MKITISMQEAKEHLVAKYAFMLGCSKEELEVEIQDEDEESSVDTEDDSESWIVNDIDSWNCSDDLRGKIIEAVYADSVESPSTMKADYFDFRLGYPWSIVKYRIVK